MTKPNHDHTAIGDALAASSLRDFLDNGTIPLVRRLQWIEEYDGLVSDRERLAEALRVEEALARALYSIRDEAIEASGAVTTIKAAARQVIVAWTLLDQRAIPPVLLNAIRDLNAAFAAEKGSA
jgi:hypothetical protein